MSPPSPVAAAKWLGLACAAGVGLLMLSESWGWELSIAHLLMLAWVVGPVAILALAARASRSRVGAWLFVTLEAALIGLNAFAWYWLSEVSLDAQNAITLVVMLPLAGYAAAILAIPLAWLLGWRARESWLNG